MAFQPHTPALAPILMPSLIAGAAAVAVATPLSALAQPTPTPATGGADDGGGCFLGVMCQNPATWLQQTITNILTDFLSDLAKDLGDAIVGFINSVSFLTRTPENLS